MKVEEKHNELVKTLNALDDHQMKLPEVVQHQDAINKSKIKKTDDEHLNISSDCWSPNVCR